MRKRHQRGSLAKVNGRWIAQWREDGRRRKRTLGAVSGMTKTEAQQVLEQILAPSTSADQLGHTLDVSLNVYAKLGLDRRAEALELFESRLRGDASKAA